MMRAQFDLVHRLCESAFQLAVNGQRYSGGDDPGAIVVSHHARPYSPVPHPAAGKVLVSIALVVIVATCWTYLLTGAGSMQDMNRMTMPM